MILKKDWTFKNKNKKDSKGSLEIMSRTFPQDLGGVVFSGWHTQIYISNLDLVKWVDVF